MRLARPARRIGRERTRRSRSAGAAKMRCAARRADERRRDASAGALALELLRRAITGFGLDELALRLLDVDLAGPAFERLARALARLERGGLVEILGAQRAVGEHGDEMRLDLEDAAGHVEEELAFFAFGGLHAHLAGTKVRQERRVTRCDADLAFPRGREHHVGLAGPDRALGADDVDVYGHFQCLRLDEN